MRKTFRAGAAAALIAFPLMMAGCSSDTNDSASSSSGGSSMSDTMTDSGSASGSGSSESMSEPSGSAMAQPFGPGCAAVPKDGAGSFSGMAKDPVATAASNNQALSTLVAAVKQANLVDTLNSAKDITVFAPTNDAFAALPKQTLDAAMADPSGLLTKVLTNHVVQGKLTPEQLAGEHTTLGGGKITVTGSGTNFKVGQATVVCGNVPTANATVYIIDQVLLPA